MGCAFLDLVVSLLLRLGRECERQSWRVVWLQIRTDCSLHTTHTPMWLVLGGDGGRGTRASGSIILCYMLHAHLLPATPWRCCAMEAALTLPPTNEQRVVAAGAAWRLR